MRRHGQDAIPAPDEARGEIAADAPPQRNPSDLARSEDLGGVVDPHDGDLVDAGGWGSWSAGERWAVLAATIVVLAVAAALIAMVVS